MSSSPTRVSYLGVSWSAEVDSFTAFIQRECSFQNKVLPFGDGGKPWGMTTACVVFSTSGASLTSGRYLVSGTGMCSDKIPLRAYRTKGCLVKLCTSGKAEGSSHGQARLSHRCHCHLSISIHCPNYQLVIKTVKLPDKDTY